MAFQINFAGKNVLVTGATRGIGAAIAIDFRETGANLILTGTNKKIIDELNETNKRNKVSNIRYIQVDFSDEMSFNNFLKELSEYDKIDVCVNNAGTNRLSLIDETKIEDYDLLTKVNLKAPFLICRQISQLMKRAHYGRIVNIASIWGVITKSQRSIYTTTKFGLVGMTKAVAVELAPYNVLVNAVSPGFTITELTKSTLSEKEMQKLAAQLPIRRFAKPEEISKVVLFLASDLNKYITGQNIIVDGGFVSV